MSDDNLYEGNSKPKSRKLRFSLLKDEGESSIIEEPNQNDSIIVYARIKPYNVNDNFLRFGKNYVQYDEIDKRGRNRIKNFTFHSIFSPDITQNYIFHQTVDKDVELFIKGQNRLIFSYGTTGSGKTYTILGNSSEPGILPRCTVKLFLSIKDNVEMINLLPDHGCDFKKLSPEAMETHMKYSQTILTLVEKSEENASLDTCDEEFKINSDDYRNVLSRILDDVSSVDVDSFTTKYCVWVSYLEVYNENIYDLLDISLDRKPLKVGMDSEKNNFVKGLCHVYVSNWIDIWKIFLYGRCRLHVDQTNLNKSSSRSHSVFTIKLITLTVNGKPTVNSFTICDLAGTERQKKAQTAGDTLKESKHINTSLMVLNKCFSIVRENKVMLCKKIPPYRESKLTQIFQKAFSYGEPVTMFVNLSTSYQLAEETKNVLRMSAVAQEMVKTMPKNNFLKPNSRFSVLCKYGFNDIASSTHGGISGIYTLTSSVTSTQIYNETKEMYEEKINCLENEIKTLKEENKNFENILKDAREEYLNLESRIEELEHNLAEEEAENYELCNDNEDLQMIAEARLSTINSLEAQINLEKEKNSRLESENSNLLSENCKLKQELEDMKIKISKLEVDKNEKCKKGRPLLQTLDHLTLTESPQEEQENYNIFEDSSTPRFLRSAKKSAKKITNKLNPMDRY